MKWQWFVLMTVLCWGAYVPTLHQGQAALPEKPQALRAFLFVGLAYGILSLAVLAYVYLAKAEVFVFSGRGISLSTIAGFFGGIGALGIVFAFRHGGGPGVVAPLVFAGAPIVATLISLAWHPPSSMPKPWFFLGILMAACGAAMVLRFKPH